MKGKIRINGAVYWRPLLPDCSCMWKIERCKIKKKPPVLSSEEINNHVEKINDEIQIYIGSINTTPLMTASEVGSKLKKINTAACKLMSKSTRHWQQKLKNRLSVSDLGTHALDNLHRYVRRQDGDLYALKSSLQTIGEFDMLEIRTLKLLTGVEAKKISITSYTDPYLARFIHATSPIWTLITGRQPRPQSFSRCSDEKIYLYAEWIQEMVIEANGHLPKQERVQEPTEEQILQIIRPRECRKIRK